MSSGTYTIVVNINQTTPAWFAVVEMAVYNDTNGGTWSVVDGKYVLTLGGGHTAGALRLFDGTSYFIAVFGNQSGKTWTGITADLTPVDTTLPVLPTFYGDGVRNNNQFWSFGSFATTDKEGRSLSIAASPDAQVVNTNLFITPGSRA